MVIGGGCVLGHWESLPTYFGDFVTLTKRKEKKYQYRTLRPVEQIG